MAEGGWKGRKGIGDKGGGGVKRSGERGREKGLRGKGRGGLSLNPLCPRILCCADMAAAWAGEGKR